ncbi:hypothetical protein MKZ38_007963 [Zalerion maritima]|uniref:Uncharacterized protein n=1 Tax=Zalerion maritima TaxID=339359 RepID=A0AAD5WNV5_9PEZI|nr:hypothetical protein MKZ38_007963 [Zalerion maritima]
MFTRMIEKRLVLPADLPRARVETWLHHVELAAEQQQRKQHSPCAPRNKAATTLNSDVLHETCHRMRLRLHLPLPPLEILGSD